MSNGIIFVWAEKEVIADVVEYFEEQEFKYVENMVVSQFSNTAIEKVADAEKENLGKRSSLLTFFSQQTVQPVTSQKCVNSPNNIDSLLEVEEKFPLVNPKDLSRLFRQDDYTYFKKTKKTLLMFRKTQEGKMLELRHQRTSDSLFDIYCPTSKNGIDYKGLGQIYRLIETLLPKSRQNPDVPLLAELFGSKKTARHGWITFCSPQTANTDKTSV